MFETTSLDQTDSRLFMRRATWCGVVFALAVLISALNFFSPFEVHYRVRSEVVISVSRIAQLKELVSQDRDVAEDKAGVHLVGVKVLDDGSRMAPPAGETRHEIALVEIESQWEEQCSAEAHHAWLEEITQAKTRIFDGTDLASQHRLARWELEAAKHYAERHDFLAKRQAPSVTNDGRSFELATASSRVGVPSTLAGYRKGQEISEGADAERAQLQEQVQLASQRVLQTELAWREQIEQSSGLLEVTSPMEVATNTVAIPFWMATSILVLGLASGSVAGWFQHRLQSGGVFEPVGVAEQLQREGVPVIGQIELPADHVEQNPWMETTTRRAGMASRRAARNLTRVSEWALGFWVLVIVARLALDPLWRGLFIESPLAAFGRLLTGLP